MGAWPGWQRKFTIIAAGQGLYLTGVSGLPHLAANVITAALLGDILRAFWPLDSWHQLHFFSHILFV